MVQNVLALCHNSTFYCQKSGTFLYRIKELFDIIVEYPDSKPAIDDLKVLACI